VNKVQERLLLLRDGAVIQDGSEASACTPPPVTPKEKRWPLRAVCSWMATTKSSTHANADIDLRNANQAKAGVQLLDFDGKQRGSFISAHRLPSTHETQLQSP
jgi:hypothetical protein